MDLNLPPLGVPVAPDKPETNLDKRLQSLAGLGGVQTPTTRQTKQAVEQPHQESDVGDRAHGQLEIDPATRRVYYTRRDPHTGDVQKFPSEAQLRMAAAMKEELEKRLNTDQAVEIAPGELLDAKA